MLLAIDVGNTNIVFAVYDGQKKLKHWRCETGADVMPAFNEMFGITAIIIGSVVPKVNEALDTVCQEKFNIKPFFVSHENVDLEILLDKPSEIGADRLIDAVAVKAHYQSPAIIVDFGTATTFDVIDAKGRYCGGVIAPGINLSLEALYKAAAKLPEVGVEKPPSVIGTNTKDAMQSGIYWGYVGLIEGTIKRIAEEMQATPYIIATGGLAPLFSKGNDIFDVVDADLIMKGLVQIHSQIAEKQNRKTA